MNITSVFQKAVQHVRQRPIVFGLAVLGIAAAAVILIVTSGPPAQASGYFDVKRGDFLISVVEGGTIEAVSEVVIRSEVEGTARIIYIVPEGSYVKKGDMLIELDSSSSQDAVNQQQISVEKAQFALIQAEQQLDIQKSMVDSEIAAATLKVEFAQTDLKKYSEGEMLQLRRNAQIEITNVVENLRIAEERLEWSEKLFTKGYETKANLDKDRLTVSQTKLKLEQAEKQLWMIETFDEKKKQRQLEAALQEAQEDLARVKLQGDRKLSQFTADVQTQKRTLELSQTKLDRDKKQLKATRIEAPQDGLVVYAGASGGGRFSSESMIEEGAVVRNRQEIIKLPDVSEMKLQVKIHESHINNIRSGQPAFVVLDSMPDQRFRGVVNRVAPLPDSSSRWGNPNLKVYATEVLVTDKLPDVKPGVSARAEVIVTNLTQVLTVPVQAVTTRKGQQVVFLAGTPPVSKPVIVGLYNTKFIEISSGLKEGDRILLSPPFDTHEKDLGGAIIAQGEDMPAADTNQLARIAARAAAANGVRRDGLPRDGIVEARVMTAAVASAADGPSRERMRDGNAPEGGDGAGGPRSGREGGFSAANREEMLKQFDKNGDGQLDETERSALRERFGGGRGPGGGGGTNRFNREDMLKQFDKNGDGEIDEEERTAMRERFGSGRRRGTNAPPPSVVQ